LLVLAGYNLSRYQLKRLTSADGISHLKSFFVRVIIPYYIILISYYVFKGSVDVPSLFLVSNIFGRFGSLLEPYWFLEALLQCTLLIVALFQLRTIRKAAADNPWIFGLVLLGVALVVRVAGHLVFHHDRLLQRTPDALFWLLAFGWCLHQAATLSRRWLMTAIVISVAVLDAVGPREIWPRFGYPANISHALWLGAAGLVILWMPRLSLPSLVQRGVGLVAAASFYIYLTHGVPVHILVRVLDVDNLAVVIPVSIAVGLAAYWVMQKLTSPAPMTASS